MTSVAPILSPQYNAAYFPQGSKLFWTWKKDATEKHINRVSAFFLRRGRPSLKPRAHHGNLRPGSTISVLTGSSGYCDARILEISWSKKREGLYLQVEWCLKGGMILPNRYPVPVESVNRIYEDSSAPDPKETDQIVKSAIELKQSGNYPNLIDFLSKQDVKRFTDPRLRDLLIFSLTKIHSPAVRSKNNIFWDLTKKMLYSYSPDPRALQLLITGELDGKSELPHLLETRDLTRLLRALDELSIIFKENFTRPESVEILRAAREAAYKKSSPAKQSTNPMILV